MKVSATQVDVFSIGASVGVVIEFKTTTLEEAKVLREVIETALNVAVKMNGGLMLYEAPMTDIEGMDLYEIFDEIIKTGISEF